MINSRASCCGCCVLLVVGALAALLGAALTVAGQNRRLIRAVSDGHVGTVQRLLERDAAKHDADSLTASAQDGRHALRTGIGGILGGFNDTTFGPYGLPLAEIALPMMLRIGAPGPFGL